MLRTCCLQISQSSSSYKSQFLASQTSTFPTVNKNKLGWLVSDAIESSPHIQPSLLFLKHIADVCRVLLLFAVQFSTETFLKLVSTQMITFPVLNPAAFQLFSHISINVSEIPREFWHSCSSVIILTFSQHHHDYLVPCQNQTFPSTLAGTRLLQKTLLR